MTAEQPRAVVLVVDDEPSNLSTFVRVFRRDVDVRIAADAEQALRQMADGAVEVVVSDYMMPGTNGIELLRQVQGIHPDVGRLLISGHQDAPELLSAVRMGWAHGVIPKPWDREQILERIAALRPQGSCRAGEG